MSDLSTYACIRWGGCGSTIRGYGEFTSISQRIDVTQETFKERVLGGGAKSK